VDGPPDPDSDTLGNADVSLAKEGLRGGKFTLFPAFFGELQSLVDQIVKRARYFSSSHKALLLGHMASSAATRRTHFINNPPPFKNDTAKYALQPSP
jgi:hypothetical protein